MSVRLDIRVPKRAARELKGIKGSRITSPQLYAVVDSTLKACDRRYTGNHDTLAACYSGVSIMTDKLQRKKGSPYPGIPMSKEFLTPARKRALKRAARKTRRVTVKGLRYAGRKARAGAKSAAGYAYRKL